MGRYWVGSRGSASQSLALLENVLHVNWGFVNSVLTSHEIELQPNLDGHEFVWGGIRNVFSLLLIQQLGLLRHCDSKLSELSFMSLMMCLCSVVREDGPGCVSAANCEYLTGMSPLRPPSLPHKYICRPL